MRISWLSNGAHVGSGYGVQTALFAPRIQGLGHDVAITALYGSEGGMLYINGPREVIPVYPKGRGYSMDVAGAHAEHFRADILLSHFDAWTCTPESFGRPWVPWFPIDCEDVPKRVADIIPKAMTRITQTRHGVEAVNKLGLDCEYVPAAFDGSVYKPVSGDVFRASMQLPDDAFLVGIVAANRGSGDLSRKAFPQMLEGYAAFQRKHPNAYLYMHCRLDPSDEGIDLEDLIRYYGIPRDHVRSADLYYFLLGYPPGSMAEMFSGLDVLLQTSIGEGFGVPIVEAQACGTPVITGDWTSMGEITRSGFAVPKSEAYRFHKASYGGDVWMIRPEAVTAALEESLGWDDPPEVVSARVAEFEADRVLVEHWKPVLERVEERLNPPAKQRAVAKRERKAAKRLAAADAA